MNSEPLVIVPIPALVTLLLNRERAKGVPLTEGEVLAIRDNAVSIALPRDVAAHMAEERGYDDIDQDNVWAEWSAIRHTFDA